MNLVNLILPLAMLPLSVTVFSLSLHAEGPSAPEPHQPPTQDILDLAGPVGCVPATRHGPPRFPPLRSRLAPAVTAVGDYVYAFATLEGGLVGFELVPLGDPPLCRGSLDGSIRTDAPPAASGMGNRVYVAIKGVDDRVYTSRATVGGVFEKWQPGHFASNHAPAVAAAGEHVYFFATAADGRIMYSAPSARDGAGWVEVEGNGRTNSSPAAAAVGNRIFLAVKGLNGRVYINQADLGGRFRGWRVSDFATDAAPAVAALDDTVYFAGKTLGGRVMYNRAGLQTGGTGWVDGLGIGPTDVSPAFVGTNSRVVAAIKGRDGVIRLSQAKVSEPFAAWF